MKTFLYIGLLLSVACNKSNDGDSTKPAISLTSPTANQQFSGFATVSLTGTIVDNDKLHEIHVYVINKATSAEVVHIHESSVNAPSYVINTSFVAQPATTYRIRIEADDNVGNESNVEIEVKAN
ncbi:MAG TPA: Ig-like domain-containing protein [Chitinophagaceae bacterium]|nr:Ig-like domain-containing protein [Chitinophagaceae bacterium]